MPLPEECGKCLLRPLFCNIDVMFENDPETWRAKALECSQLDVLARVRKVEEFNLNKIDRARVLDEFYPFFFDSNLLAFPVELLKRSVTDKFDQIFPEYAENSSYIKWALGVEVIQKFCQMSETLAAHLLASQTAGNDYESYEGYVGTLLTYSVREAVEFFQHVSQMGNADLIQIICYPDPDAQLASIVEGKLHIEDVTGEESVYFLPVTHGGNFVLETKVKLIQGYHSVYVAAQLLTRDSSKQNYESGMALLPELDQAIARHMADEVDYVYKAFEINMSIEYGEWYVMRLMVLGGRMRAFVDGNEIYDSNSSFPVTTYGEPHLAVRYGVALCEYVGILII